jgi:hypothetical protein
MPQVVWPAATTRVVRKVLQTRRRAMRKDLVRQANRGRVGEGSLRRCFSAVFLNGRQSGCKSRPWGPGLLASEFVQRGWRGELLPGDRQHRGRRPRRPVQTTGGEKLNHERRDRTRKRALASKTLKRRRRTANVRVGALPQASAFVGGNLANARRVWPAGRRHIPTRTGQKCVLTTEWSR